MGQYDKLLININKAQEDIQKMSALPLDKLTLENKDIVKNMLANDMPKLEKEDIDIMVDGFKTFGNNALDFAGEKLSQAEEALKSMVDQGDTPFKIKQIKDKIKQAIEDQDIFPLAIDSAYYEKAKELKNELVEKILGFVRKVKELLTDFVNMIVSLATTIPGAALMLAPFAFNVPGMITLLFNFLMLISKFITKCIDVREKFRKFNKINLIFSDGALELVASVINKLYEVLVESICKPFKLIFGGIKATIDDLISKTIDNDGKSARKVCRKLKKLDYIRKVPPLYGDWEINTDIDDEDDLDEIEFLIGPIDGSDPEVGSWKLKSNWQSKGVCVERKLDLKSLVEDGVVVGGKKIKIQDIESQIDNFMVDLDIPSKIEDINLDEYTYVYDVELPNGEIILGLSEDEFDFYQDKYIILYSNSKYRYSSEPIYFGVSKH